MGLDRNKLIPALNFLTFQTLISNKKTFPSPDYPHKLKLSTV